MVQLVNSREHKMPFISDIVTTSERKKEWSADGFKTVNRCLKHVYPRRCEMSINIVAEGPKVPGIWGPECPGIWRFLKYYEDLEFEEIWGYLRSRVSKKPVDKGSEALVLEGSYILRESEGQKFWEFGGQEIWGRIWGILRALKSGAREPKDWLGRDQGNGSPCHLPWASQAQVPY